MLPMLVGSVELNPREPTVCWRGWGMEMRDWCMEARDWGKDCCRDWGNALNDWVSEWGRAVRF
jgi:hypothetical protein